MDLKKNKYNKFIENIKIVCWLSCTPLIFSQSIVTDITRDLEGNIASIEYFSTVSKKVELIKLETYYPNGQVSLLESFFGGKKNGLHQEFYENGKIKKKGQYKDGDENGLWTDYYTEGGVLRMYYANTNGKNGSINEWFENGEKKINGVYSEGLKHGIWISWFSNGLKESMVTYNKGKMEGVFIYYYKNGNKKSEGMVTYKGQKEERCWDEDGSSKKCSNVN